MQCDEPQYGWLLDDLLFADRARIETSLFIRPRLEVELAFVMAADLVGLNVTLPDVLQATEYVQPALEIVDYRTDVPRSPTDMVADNTAGAGIVLGGRPVRPGDIDLRWVPTVLSRNAIVEETGVSAAVPGHPAEAVAVLANKLALVGRHLRKGDIVLAGSLTRQIDVGAGDTFKADFNQLGSVEVAFK